jgi:hypothetical protein
MSCSNLRKEDNLEEINLYSTFHFSKVFKPDVEPAPPLIHRYQANSRPKAARE